MAFLNPLFLLGALAAGIPVLVHLVRRTRAAKLQFASLMFLRRIEQKTIRQRKLRNLLLLAMRCAALVLLALAFSRPYFTSANSSAASSNHTSSVILIDASYSMRYGDVFDRARQAARKVINDSAADAELAIVTFASGYDIVMPLKASRAEANTLVDQMQAGLGSTDYLQAIQAAVALLKDAAGHERRIYLISDFQDAGWNRSTTPVKLPPDIKLIPVDVSESNPKNIAVSDVKADPVVYAQKYAGKVVARVGNFSTEALDDATIELKLNDLTVERRPLKLDAGASQAIEFTGFNVPEGSNRATVEVTGDTFPLDNKFFFTIRRDNQTRVLVIDTAVRGRSESFFVQQSLMAGENNQHGLTVKTPGTVNPTDLDLYRVVIVNDATGINEALASALKQFAERGGGLILAAGKHTDDDDFNRVFGELSPAHLDETVRSRGYALMSQVKTDHPIFSAFSGSGRLTSTRVYAYHRATPRDGTLTLAALDDASPIVVEGSAGRGKVLLVTTTLDTAWNDLPLTPMFLPLVRQMLEYLDGRDKASKCMVGQVFSAPADRDGSMPAIDAPSGRRVDDARANQSGEQSVDAAEIGFYRLRYRDRNEFAAVNLDMKESDLAKLNLDEFIAAISRGEDQRSVQPSQSPRLTAEETEAKQHLWLPLLVVALMLFVAEAVIARRIRIVKLIG
jgi:Mg-chelatase subunit ChlD